jgi:alpha/beta superfamily hydrolase
MNPPIRIPAAPSVIVGLERHRQWKGAATRKANHFFWKQALTLAATIVDAIWKPARHPY